MVGWVRPRISRRGKWTILDLVFTTGPTGSVISPRGDLDALSAPTFRVSVNGIEPGNSVLVDLSGVGFVDSVGLGALVGVVRRVRESGGTVVIASGGTATHRVLVATGFEAVAPLVTTLAEAEALVPGRDS